MTKQRDAQPLGWLRQFWLTVRSTRWLGAGQYSGNYNRLDRLYLLNDPWKLMSQKERARFDLTNQVIARIAPECGSLLEIGAGEGVQTRYLQQVSREVIGIEVSPVAAERARAAVPDVEFLVGRAEDVGRLVGGRRFDVITACEMLYFVPDVGRVLAVLKGMASHILVTSYEKRAGGLAQHFQGPGWSREDDIVVDGTSWRCYVWTAPKLGDS